MMVIIQNKAMGKVSKVQILIKCSGAFIRIKTIAVRTIPGKINCPLMNGTLNLDSGLSILVCKTNTPPQTNTKANKVPILVNASTTSRFKNKAGIATTSPVRIVEKDGVPKRG